MNSTTIDSRRRSEYDFSFDAEEGHRTLLERNHLYCAPPKARESRSGMDVSSSLWMTRERGEVDQSVNLMDTRCAEYSIPSNTSPNRKSLLTKFEDIFLGEKDPPSTGHKKRAKNVTHEVKEAERYTKAALVSLVVVFCIILISLSSKYQHHGAITKAKRDPSTDQKYHGDAVTSVPSQTGTPRSPREAENDDGIQRAETMSSENVDTEESAKSSEDQELEVEKETVIDGWVVELDEETVREHEGEAEEISDEDEEDQTIVRPILEGGVQKDPHILPGHHMEGLQRPHRPKESNDEDNS